MSSNNPVSTTWGTTKGMLKKLQLREISRDKKLSVFLWFVAALIVIGIYWYYRAQIKKERRDLRNMTSALAKVPVTMTGIGGSDGQNQYLLRDYYIASSYNSCCPGDFLDDYVSLEALKNVIRRGARLLDFEIYSYKGKAVVAASPGDSYHYKGTYNSIPVGEVFNTVSSYAFSSGCPNPKDPLFLHLRIKTNKMGVYKSLTDALTSNFTNLLAQSSSEYANESHGENITNKPLLTFLGKVVIIVNNATKNFRGSEFEELINLVAGGNFVRDLRSHQVIYSADPDELREYNKKQMSVVMPDLSSLDRNQNAALQQKYGCQFTCMNYQKMDTNLEYYLKFFSNSAFVLKPSNMRYQIQTIKAPPPQDPALSYAPRAISMPQFQGNI